LTKKIREKNWRKKIEKKRKKKFCAQNKKKVGKIFLHKKDQGKKITSKTQKKLGPTFFNLENFYKNFAPANKRKKRKKTATRGLAVAAARRMDPPAPHTDPPSRLPPPAPPYLPPAPAAPLAMEQM